MKTASTIFWLLCIYGLHSCQYFLPNEKTKRGKKKTSIGSRVAYGIKASYKLLKQNVVESKKKISQEALTFKAKQQAEKLLLHWTMKKNNQTKAFVLERSKDGQFYENLATIEDDLEGAFKHYSYTDWFPLNGTNYYRLRQFYQDGSSSVSTPKIISFNLKKERWIIVHPIDKGFHLRLDPTKIEFPIQLELFNEYGERLSTKTYNYSDIDLYLPLNVIDPIYTIKVITSNRKIFLEQLKIGAIN